MHVGALAGLALIVSICGGAPSVRADETRASLVPDRAPAFRASRVFESLRAGARTPRALRIETTPAGARLDVAYWRADTALARATGVAPFVVQVPGRALMGAGDRIVVRAQLDGYAPAELGVAARELGTMARLALTPLPRTLVGVSLLELGRYARLELVGDGALDARLARTAAGWRLVVADAAPAPHLAAALASLRGGTIANAAARVVGADWILELETSEPRDPPRLLRRDEALRPRSQLTLEWLPGSAHATLAYEAERASASLTRDALGACAAAFERELVQGLGQDAIARSLARTGSVSDALLLGGMKRLAGLAPDHLLPMRDGSRIRLDTPLGERTAVLRASEARGALVMLRVLTDALAPAGAGQRSLHAWLAPERTPEEFAATLARAARSEARCRRP